MDFNKRCYKLISKIPRGRVTSYKEIAKALNTKAYRAIGNAMAKNPHLVIIPCHRVIRNNGEVGGYVLGVNRKIELLKVEGISTYKGKVVDFKKIFIQLI